MTITKTKTMLNDGLKRVDLDFEKTLPEFLENIEFTNKLSQEVIKRVDFSKGRFFTLLPEDVDFTKIYDIRWSIIPQHTPIRDERGGGYWQRTLNTSEEVTEIIARYIEGNEYTIVADEADLERSYECVQNATFPLYFFNEEVYYVLDYCNEADIYNVLRSSDLRWHMIFVIAQGKYKWNKELNEEFFESVCQNIECIVTTAYDAESYLLWESTRRII